MTRRPLTDETFDAVVREWLDERAIGGPAADATLDAALARTSRARPLPAWLLPERIVPTSVANRTRSLPRAVPILLLVGLLLAAALAIAIVGSPRRLPPPFGLAAPGSVAFLADGHIWTANADGSNRKQLTTDSRTDGYPTFSRDGTKIAFHRLPVPNSKPDWQDWGDVIVTDADGQHPIVIDPLVHSPSPMTWSPDSRFIVYARTVGDVDQVFIAAADGSSRRQVTQGTCPAGVRACRPMAERSHSS